MGNLINFDNKFFRGIGKVVDCFYISILWVLACVPVITIGASTAALYVTAHKVLRRGEGYIWKTFVGAFKSNFKQTTKIWLIMLAAFLVLFVDYQVTKGYLEQGSTIGIFCYFFFIMLLFEYIWAVYTLCYAARFELDMKAIMKNGAIFAVVKLPWSFLILVIFAIAVVIIMFLPFLIILLPAAVAILYEVILEKIFRQFMKPEDLEKEIQRDWEDYI